MAALFQKRKKEPAEKAPVEAAQALQETIVCPACGREINKKEAEKNLYVCYECGSYFSVRTRNRIRMMADAGTFTPWFEDLAEANPLEFGTFHVACPQTADNLRTFVCAPFVAPLNKT